MSNLSPKRSVFAGEGAQISDPWKIQVYMFVVGAVEIEAVFIETNASALCT